MTTAEQLQRLKPVILRRWEAAARAALPAARGESRPILLNSLPTYLDEMAQALDHGGGNEQRGAPREHAEQRAALTDYSLNEVIAEYGLLESAILDAMQAEAPLDADDLRVILHTIQLGVAEAATHFVEIQEMQLRDSEERFRLLVESVKDYAIFMLDTQGRVSSWNKGAQRLKGYAADEIIGQSFAVFYPLEDQREGRPQNGLRAASEQGRFSDEGWRVRQDGTRFLAHVVITAMRDEHGVLRGYSKVTRDVSERLAFDERYRSVVNTVLDGIITIDEQSRIHTFNPAAEQMFGYSADEVLGRHISMLMPEPYRHEHDQYMENYFSTGRPKVIGIGREVAGQRKDGTAFPMELAVGEFRIGDGRFFTGIVRDITDRLRLEAELRRRADELGEQNRRKDEFLAILGHELRNPMAAIRASTEVLRLRAGDDPVVARSRDVITRQTLHLVRLVDDLLDVARLNKGRLKLKLEEVDLVSLVHQAIDTVQPHIDERKQCVVTHLPDGAVLVLADPARVVQSLSNLLHNASKFSGPATIDVTVISDGKWARVDVTDHGAGMEPELLDQVFDLFARGVRWVNRMQSGLGIGLKLSKTFVELHGGTLEASSDGVGQGSTFTLSLPVHVSRDRRSVPKESDSMAVSQQSRRVLVVDDNADAAHVLVDMLRIWGHEAEAIFSGGPAVGRVREWRPEVVLLDISLPDIDGYEVARQLRHEDGLPHPLQLVAVTGFGQDGDKERARRAGFDDHLTKPVDLHALQKLLETSKP